MRYPPALLDEIRAALPVSQIVARRVKLQRAGREFKGLSPFKQEKTPSFTVNDQKGFYHCFATGEHGDIFKFVMQTEGLSFPETVERLAGEAGVPLPKSSPEAMVRAEQNDRLREITALSAEFFKNALDSAAAEEARNYLQKRGISKELQSLFGLGFAPNSRDALKNHLLSKGCSEADIILSGMAIGGPDINIPYDRFRGRIMFPITDMKQQVIAFGGRALDPDQPAKYLNSPETPLFHKGHQLYNAASARKTAYDRKNIIITEGYMDVIAMHKAGFENTVAPLGTALTPEQILLLWRMAEEPILCFDGDSAGQKAANRAVETALPLLKPGYSLKFAFLPDGQDPDDLLNTHGREEMQAILKAARPLSEVLWQKEYLKEQWNTPERRAALEHNLLGLISEITDPTVKTHYTREIKSRLWRAFQNRGDFRQNNAQNINRAGNYPSNGRQNAKPGAKAGAKSMWQQRAPASLSLKTSPLLSAASAAKNSHDSIILALLINHPWLLETEDETVSSLMMTTSNGETLKKALLEAHFMHNPLDRGLLETHLDKMGLRAEMKQVQDYAAQNGPRYTMENTTPADVQNGWQELMVRHHRAEELKQELQAAEKAYFEEESQDNFERLRSVQQALEQAENSTIEVE